MNKTITRCKVATKSGELLAPAHFVGEFLAVTVPVDAAHQFPTVRGQWVITHRGCGLSAATLRCCKATAIKLARQWDGRFGCIDPADARAWPWRDQWGAAVAAINCPNVQGAADPADSTDTAGVFAARAGLPIDQAGGALRIFWRGKFWPAPTDAELEFWTLDSVCETPDGRTVEPDAPESWLRILRIL
jgi:hypothetical protein